MKSDADQYFWYPLINSGSTIRKWSRDWRLKTPVIINLDTLNQDKIPVKQNILVILIICGYQLLFLLRPVRMLTIFSQISWSWSQEECVSLAEQTMLSALRGGNIAWMIWFFVKESEKCGVFCRVWSWHRELSLCVLLVIFVRKWLELMSGL